MLKKFLTILMIIFVLIGVIIGIYFAKNDQTLTENPDEINYSALCENLQNKKFNLREFYTYGKALNISGSLTGIEKDNFEDAKLYITDGKEFEQTFILNSEFEKNELIIYSNKEINSGLILDDLECGKYVVLLRVKLNNSINPKYYSFTNLSDDDKIEYFSITQNESNKKIDIEFENYEYEEKNVSFLSVNVEKSELPEDVYDIVIDAGHGGTDEGEKTKQISEAKLALEYSKLLKNKLEEKGLKVKLTRDDENSKEFTDLNMYDEDGRISIACKSKAKLMISFHANNKDSNGFEIYCPCRSNLEFAKNMANKINSNVGISYSSNSSYLKYDGVYVKNYTKNMIDELAKTAEKNGYSPYDITTETPYLYTIREVGGIATNAYVDGRNTKYSANRYYKSNQGIECYQIELGDIKNDEEVLLSKMDEYVSAISDAIFENYLK